MKMGLLENAVDSIALGLEDYQSQDGRRVLSSVRNIYAGILLLFKHKLSELSPPGSNEVLVRRKMIPQKMASGKIEFVGTGERTVDYGEIKERFEDLKINVDWKRMGQIKNFRNDVEHYHSDISPDARRKSLSECFLVIRDFIGTHLKRDPQEVLGQLSWSVLLSENEVYEAEKRGCIDTFKEIDDWKSEALYQALKECLCESCESGLIRLLQPVSDRERTHFECKSCEKTYDFEKMALIALEQFFDWDSYSAIRHGGDLPIIECPNCSESAYIVSEQQCAICLEKLEHTCQSCDGPIPVSELELANGYCGWCNHMIGKDD